MNTIAGLALVFFVRFHSPLFLSFIHTHKHICMVILCSMLSWNIRAIFFLTLSSFLLAHYAFIFTHEPFFFFLLLLFMNTRAYHEWCEYEPDMHVHSFIYTLMNASPFIFPLYVREHESQKCSRYHIISSYFLYLWSWTWGLHALTSLFGTCINMYIHEWIYEILAAVI